MLKYPHDSKSMEVFIIAEQSLAKYELWKSRIADYHDSGLTAQAWCDGKQIKRSTLQYWICKFNKTANSKLPEFVPVPGTQDLF